MYRTTLLLLYLLILAPTITHLIRCRDVPSSRRLSVGLGVAGVLLAPTAASLLCELFSSLLSVGLYVLICFIGIGLMLKSLFIR